MDEVRIATRRSALAMAQAEMVANLIRDARPDAAVSLAPMSTRGDRAAGPLTRLGGKGLFTAELEQALRTGQVDLAVHSAKDLPAELPGDMTIAACPARADARDALVSAAGWSVEDLPDGARVGTGSPRRGAQLQRVRPDLQIVPIRGNVQTRLGKAVGGELDAVVLAMAGLIRSGLAQPHAGHIRPLEIEACIPAAGQAIIAIQTLTEARAVRDLLAALDHDSTSQALQAERAIVRALGANCTSLLGVHIHEGAGWAGRAVAGDQKIGLKLVYSCVEGQPSASAVAERLVADLLAQGVTTPLGEPA